MMNSVLDQFIPPDLRNLVLSYERSALIAISGCQRPPQYRRDFVKLTRYPWLPDAAYESVVKREFSVTLAPDMKNPFSTWRQYYNYLLAMFRYPADVLTVTVDPGVTVINIGQKPSGMFVGSINMNPDPCDEGTYIDFKAVTTVNTTPHQIVVAKEHESENMRIYVSITTSMFNHRLLELVPATSPHSRDEGYAKVPLELLLEISPRYFDQVDAVMVWGARMTFSKIKVEITPTHLGWCEGQIFVVFQHLGVRYGIIFADYSDHPMAPYWGIHEDHDSKKRTRYRHTEEQYLEIQATMNYTQFNNKFMSITCESLYHRSLFNEPIYNYISSRYSVHPMLIMREREGIYFYRYRGD